MEPALVFLIVVAAAGAVAPTLHAFIRWTTTVVGHVASVLRSRIVRVGVFVAAVGGPTTLSWPVAAVTPPPLDRLVPLPPGGAPGGVAVALADEPVAPFEYRVAPGDSLWAIAARHLGTDDPRRIDDYWREVYTANRAVVGDDPHLIFPGQVLVLPSEA